MGKAKKQRGAAGLKSVALFCMGVLLIVSGCQSRPEAEQIQRQGERSVLHMGNITFEMETMVYSEEVKPEKPRGYYDYYEAQEGYRYLVIRGNLRNEGSEEAALDSCSVFVTAGKKDRAGVLTSSDELESSFQDKLAAGEEAEGYLIALIGEKEEPDSLQIYYNAGWATPDEGEKYEFTSEVSLDEICKDGQEEKMAE